MYLLKYPDKIIEFKKKLSEVKKSFIRTWKERMDEETVILKKLVDDNLLNICSYLNQSHPISDLKPINKIKNIAIKQKILLTMLITGLIVMVILFV